MKMSPYISDALEDVDNINPSSTTSIHSLKNNLVSTFKKLENRPGTFLFPTTLGKINELKEDIGSICDDLMPYCETMATSLSKLEQQKKDLQASIKETSKRIHELDKETQKLKEELDNLIETLSKQSEAHAGLDAKLKKANVFGKIFQKKMLEQYKLELENTTKDIETAKDKKSAIELSIKQKGTDKDSSLTRKNTLTAQMDDLRKSISEAEAKHRQHIDEKKRDLKHLFNHVNMIVEKNDKQLNTKKPKIILARNIR